MFCWKGINFFAMLNNFRGRNALWRAKVSQSFSWLLKGILVLRSITRVSIFVRMIRILAYQLISERDRYGCLLHSRYCTSCRRRGFLARERRPAGHGSWVHLQYWCERWIFDYSAVGWGARLDIRIVIGMYGRNPHTAFITREKKWTTVQTLKALVSFWIPESSYSIYTSTSGRNSTWKSRYFSTRT